MCAYLRAQVSRRGLATPITINMLHADAIGGADAATQWAHASKPTAALWHANVDRDAGWRAVSRGRLLATTSAADRTHGSLSNADTHDDMIIAQRCAPSLSHPFAKNLRGEEKTIPD